MAYTEDLYIFKDTQTLCEKLLEYSRNVSKLIRYGEYSVMISKACQAMDLVRQINSSFEGRDEGITRYILLIAEVKSRINLFARSQFLPLKNATNLGLTLHPRKISLQRTDKGVRFIGAMIRPHRMYANPRTVQALLDVIGEWNCIENPTDEETLKYIMRCNSYLGYLVHRNSRRARELAWRSIHHKDKVYCLNMKCLKIKNEFKVR